MRTRAPLESPFTRREWQHLMGMTAADWIAYAAFLLLVAMYFCPDALGDALLAGAAVIASLASFVVGWRHDPECSDFANALSLISYPMVPLITALVVGVRYS